MKSDFSCMWEAATEEVQETYGREYLDQHNKLVEDAIPTACTNLNLVTDAIVHALFAQSPNTRYLINGSTSWMDIYWVTVSVYLSVCLSTYLSSYLAIFFFFFFFFLFFFFF